MKTRRPAAPPRIVERRILPPRRLRRDAVFPGGTLRDHSRLHRRRRRRKIRRPRSPADLRARPPIFRPRRPRVRIAFRQSRPAAVRRDRPRAFVAVGQLVHRPVVVIQEPQRIAGIAQHTGKWSERSRDQSRRFRDHQMPARRNHHVIPERKIHPARDPPVRNIHIHPHHIKQLDPLPRLPRTRGIVVDFIKNDDRIIRRKRSDGREQASEQNKQRKEGFHRRMANYPSSERGGHRNVTELEISRVAGQEGPALQTKPPWPDSQASHSHGNS